MPENASGETKNDIKITCGQNAVFFSVKVIPASSRTGLAGVQNGIIRIKLSAAPEKGKANQALIEFLADLLGVKKKIITITSGLTTKVKQIAVEQETSQAIIEKLRSVL
ncbi:MAG: DUF167 domain-containing protein [Sedimentisphaerales bacterium]